MRTCPDCGALTKYRHMSRRCPGYAPLWAGDAEQKLFRNFERLQGALMVTLTAPGAEMLPWDLAHCQGLGDHRHSGVLGCQVRLDRAEWWNEWCRTFWSELWDDVQAQVRREFGDVAPLAGYVWEKQLRGVWHQHVVLDTSTWAARVRSDRAAELLKERAPRHGFGREVVFDVARSDAGQGGRQVAAYLASYLLGGKQDGHKRPLRETVRTLEPASTIIYVARRLTSKTGVTMRSLRHKRWLHFRISNLPAWLHYVSIEGLYEAVREGWWRHGEFREDALRVAQQLE